MPAQKASAKASKKAVKAKPAAVSKAKPSKASKDAKAKPKVALKPAKAAKPVAKKPESKPSLKANKKPDAKVSKASAVEKAPTKASAKPVLAEKAGKPPKEAKGAKPHLTAVKNQPVPAVELEAPELEAAEEIVEETEQPRHVVSLREAMEKPITEKKKKKDELKIDRTGDLETQWKALFEKSKAVKPLPYKMSESYEARTPLQHKVLGWGYVLTSQNNRLEVLFKDGIKFLISNYKS